MSGTIFETDVWVVAGVALIGGFVLGLAYFWVLRRTVDLHVASRGWLAPVGLTIGRLGGAALSLALLARLGPAALLGGLSGFVVARTIVLHFAREER
jgi:hypothetical protein